MAVLCLGGERLGIFTVIAVPGESQGCTGRLTLTSWNFRQAMTEPTSLRKEKRQGHPPTT